MSKLKKRKNKVTKKDTKMTLDILQNILFDFIGCEKLNKAQQRLIDRQFVIAYNLLNLKYGVQLSFKFAPIKEDTDGENNK